LKKVTCSRLVEIIFFETSKDLSAKDDNICIAIIELKMESKAKNHYVHSEIFSNNKAII